MSFFKRICTVFRANVNHALTQVEDAEKILNQTILEMNEQLADAKRKVAAAIADEKRLQKRQQESAAQADQWEENATSAVQKDRDDLACEALSRRNEHQQLAGEYMAQWEKQKEAVDQFKEHLQVLQRKIEEASRKKNLLIARQKRAKAQKQIHETMAGMKENTAFDAFERMEQKVDDAEASADALVEMAADSTDAKLEEEFAQLEGTSSVDADLAALKAKVTKDTSSVNA